MKIKMTAIRHQFLGCRVKLVQSSLVKHSKVRQKSKQKTSSQVRCQLETELDSEYYTENKFDWEENEQDDEETDGKLSNKRIKDIQRQLTRRFKQERSIGNIRDLIVENWDYMNFISVSVAASAVSSLVQYQRPTLKHGGFVINTAIRKTFIYTYTLLSQLMSRFYQEMGAVGIANCIWSLGVAKDILELDKDMENFEELLHDLGNHAATVREGYTLEQCLRSLVALKEYPEKNRPAIDKILEKALEYDMDDYNRKGSFYMLEIIAAIDMQDEVLLKRFIEYAGRKQFLPKHEQFMTILMTSIAKLRYHTTGILSQLRNFLLSKRDVTGLYGSATVGMAWVIADLAQKADSKEIMARNLAFLVQGQRKRTNLQHYIEFLYYLSAARCPYGELMLIKNAFLDKLMDRFENLNHQQLCRIRQAQIFCSMWKYDMQWPPQLDKLCESAWRVEVKKLVTQVEMQSFIKEVFDKLKEKYPKAVCGALTEDEQLVISILIASDEYKVAVEPRSLQFFTQSEPYDLIGTKQMELYALKKRGYEVVLVSQKDWNEQGDSYVQTIFKEIQDSLDGVYAKKQVQQKEIKKEVLKSEDVVLL